jgi:hypothetical protein
MQLRGAARRGAAQGVVRTAEAVDHSCVPSESSERDGAWRAGDAALRDALVVEEANMVAAHRIEERHVLQLRLDGMGEEGVRSPGEEVGRRNLLHAQDRCGLTQVFRQQSTSILILCI